MLDGAPDTSKSLTNLLDVWGWQALFLGEPLQIVFDLFMSTFVRKQVLKKMGIAKCVLRLLIISWRDYTTKTEILRQRSTCPWKTCCWRTMYMYMYTENDIGDVRAAKQRV